MPADHRRRRQARERGRHPVAARHADDDAVTDAGAPGDRQHQINVGRGIAMPERRAARDQQNDQPGHADGNFEAEPGDEESRRLAGGDRGCNHERIDHAAGKDRQRPEQVADKLDADVVGHAGTAIGEPARHSPARQAVESVPAIHDLPACSTGKPTAPNNRLEPLVCFYPSLMKAELLLRPPPPRFAWSPSPAARGRIEVITPPWRARRLRRAYAKFRRRL
jgi:hypothetical protein